MGPAEPINANTQTTNEEGITLSEVVSALSFALDLTEDAVPGHAIRSCLLGMRIGNALGLQETELRDLYYALLLKDIGCSSNAGRMCQILGSDDRSAKREVKLLNWTQTTVKGLLYAWRHVMPGKALPLRLWRMAQLAKAQDANNVEIFTLRCERGGEILRKIGFSDACAQAIYSLDEHWDGSGYPRRLKGTEIPLLARILGIAQHLDVFACELSRTMAIRTLKERSGTWFDPELVTLALKLDQEGTLWEGVDSDKARELVLALEPGAVQIATGSQIDRVCEGFADVVDAKSSFTYRHSLGVMEMAVAISRKLGLSPEREQLVYRAALLHDLGKLGVSNSILDKPGALTSEEWVAVRAHPRMSQQILERIPSFGAIARIAGRHHEKLDGSGYPFGLAQDQLGLEDRILVVADLYAAITEDRPYRKGLPKETVIRMLRTSVPEKLDALCVEALVSVVNG